MPGLQVLDGTALIAGKTYTDVRNSRRERIVFAFKTAWDGVVQVSLDECNDGSFKVTSGENVVWFDPGVIGKRDIWRWLGVQAQASVEVPAVLAELPALMIGSFGCGELL